LVTFQANPAGAQIAQTIGLLRKVLTSSESPAGQNDQRFLLLTRTDSATPELIQGIDNDELKVNGGIHAKTNE